MAEAPRRIELATAILLSCAGLASGWASYQAALWGGVQASHYAVATSKMTQASALAIIDGQRNVEDIALFMAWLEAAAEGDAKRMAFYERHFAPELKTVFGRWRSQFPADLRTAEIRTDGPTGLPSILHSEARKALQLRRDADAAFAAGEAANDYSDHYVATTVMLAIVLFLAGISASLQRDQVRIALLILATLLGVAAVGTIATLPVQTL